MDQSSGSDMVEGESFVSGIVLAGGESRRMGHVNKALLDVGGLKIIERVAGVLEQVFDEILVITNTPEDFRFLGLPMIQDIRPGYGALGGLYTGLRSCRNEYGFLVACDMPFLDVRVMRHMVGLIGGQDVVIPRVGGRLQPLHAIYSRKCIEPIERSMAADDLKIYDLFHEVDVLEVPESVLAQFDPGLRFVININTFEDLERARGLADPICSA